MKTIRKSKQALVGRHRHNNTQKWLLEKREKRKTGKVNEGVSSYQMSNINEKKTIRKPKQALLGRHRHNSVQKWLLKK